MNTEQTTGERAERFVGMATRILGSSMDVAPRVELARALLAVAMTPTTARWEFFGERVERAWEAGAMPPALYEEISRFTGEEV